MRVTTVEEVGRKRWDDFVNSHDQASAYHLSFWESLLKQVFNSQCYYLAAISDSGVMCGVLPLVHFKNRLFGQFMVSMPYFNSGGILADGSQAESALINHAIEVTRSVGASHIELREFSPRNSTWKYKDEKVLMYLDLPSDPEAYWNSIGSKLRSQIKRPDREGVSFRVGKTELLDDFYSVFSRNMRDLGTPVYSKELFRTILEIAPASMCNILTVYMNKMPVAAAFLVGYKQTMEIPWASSVRDFNRFGVNMKLYWEVIKYSIMQGYRVFDFGRSTKGGATYKFKKQWGAVERQCYWNYWLASGGDLPRLNPQNPKYKIAIECWKKLPLPVANYIGPHIVKRLP